MIYFTCRKSKEKNKKKLRNDGIKVKVVTRVLWDGMSNIWSRLNKGSHSSFCKSVTWSSLSICISPGKDEGQQAREEGKSVADFLNVFQI